ncbi:MULTISPECIES: UDP-galactopyranose mutase [unclassified Oceanispirochaeta]|uniref:UDP-galactopyranose mutase n=1 Tax=unclassified Oceanispirochaeta TaxID=2635722 RepID=UPI000E08E448|nr:MULTISPECIES: UDP-galactopyranose mutase [unclassified Oceanispirochaeta]MBF9014420.1 UDP-galactopyranose mutase [Oceanispirochaeta sp. M2]NPD74974.1 UDP-galactopyranose mutase [Oceanispirochaeta sp. M1]RDG29150.1 UDP-galactopyranose mutase [Oceanispirochaeta sp. M1]
MKKKEYLIVGAGLFGIVLAEQLSKAGNKVIIIDKRPHIGGNCFDKYDKETNILYHVYGPHIFHIEDENILNYVKKFTNFNHYFHQVLTTYKDRIYQMPINLETINSFYGLNLKPFEVEAFLKKEIEKEQITTPKNMEEKVISLIGKQLYEAFFKDYTSKQWGKNPIDLPENIVSRIPIRNNYYESYYNKSFHGIPQISFSSMFEEMINNENIEIKLNCEYFENRKSFHQDSHVIYTGPIDRYFNYKFGKLEYRALEFKTEYKNVDDFQGTSVINYPESQYKYTRICEPKHFYRENWNEYVKNKTLIIKEIPLEDDGTNPFYPINNDKNNKIAEKYRKEGAKTNNVSFGGRLGEYKYFDMEDTIKSALTLFSEL